MIDYLIYIIFALLLANGIRTIIVNVKQMRELRCPFCDSKNVSKNPFRHKRVCNVCGQDWVIPKTIGSDGGGGGGEF